MSRVEAKFAKLAAESREHPAYWKARLELEQDEHKATEAALRRMRRWIFRWLHEGVPSRQTGDIGSSMFWRIPPEEIRMALAGKTPPRRRR